VVAAAGSMALTTMPTAAAIRANPKKTWRSRSERLLPTMPTEPLTTVAEGMVVYRSAARPSKADSAQGEDQEASALFMAWSEMSKRISGFPAIARKLRARDSIMASIC
jgi:hypothetical protein